MKLTFLTLRNEGRRTDLLRCKTAFEDGHTLFELFRNEETWPTAVQFHRGLALGEQALKWRKHERTLPITVTILFGPTGTGKTRGAFLIDPDPYRVQVPTGAQLWFDRYEGQKTLLIDEYQGWIPWAFLKTLLDPWQPLSMLPVKGTFLPTSYSRIIICSNIHPLKWHPNQRIQQLRQLTRRVTSCWECNMDVFQKVDLTAILEDFAKAFGDNAAIPSDSI